MENLKKEFHELYGRLPHYKWSKERIQEEINKKKHETIIVEQEAPVVDPVNIDPIVLQLLKGQQEILGKLTESIDELKRSVIENKPVTPEEAKALFDEELKTSYFKSNYRYQIYALTRIASDGSEEWNITGHEFGTEEEATEYGDKHFKSSKGGKQKYKIIKIKKPYLVKNKENTLE